MLSFNISFMTACECYETLFSDTDCSTDHKYIAGSAKPLVLTDIQIQNQSQFEISSIKLKYKQGEIIIHDLKPLQRIQRRLQTPDDTDLTLDLQYHQGAHYREHLTFVMQAGTVGQLDLNITPQQELDVRGDFSSQ